MLIVLTKLTFAANLLPVANTNKTSPLPPKQVGWFPEYTITEDYGRWG